MTVKDYNPLNNTGILQSTLVYINKQINERMERKLFLGVKCQTVKVKGMTGLQNLHSTTITVTVHPGKKHQWILKLLGENEMRNEILHGLEYLFIVYL